MWTLKNLKQLKRHTMGPDFTPQGDLTGMFLHGTQGCGSETGQWGDWMGADHREGPMEMYGGGRLALHSL